MVNVALPEEVTPDNTLFTGSWVIGIADHTAEAIFNAPLAAGGTSIFTIPVTIKKDVFGTITAIAEIKDADSGAFRMPSDIPKNSASADTTMAGLDISVVAKPTEPTLGQTITYTVTVTNNTGIALKSVTVQNLLEGSQNIAGLYCDPPSDCNYTPGGRDGLFWTDNGLAVGAQVSYDITTHFTRVNDKDNSATIRAIITEIEAGSSKLSGNFGSNSATATVKVIDWSKLTINVSAPTSAKPGDTIEYTVTVKNDTGVDLNTVEVEYPLLSGLTYTGQTPDSGDWDFTSGENPNAAKGTLTALKATKSAAFTVTATVNDGVSGDIEIYARILSAMSGSYFCSEPIFSNTVTMNIEPEPCVSISMSVSPSIAFAQEFTYTVEVNNNGGVALEEVTLTDYLPRDSVLLVSLSKRENIGLVTYNADALVRASEAYIKINNLAANQKASFSVTAKFQSDKAQTAVNRAVITGVKIAGEDMTKTLVNTEATATAYSLRNLDIEHSVDKGTSTPGDTLTYTVEVTNKTLIDLSEVHVDYTLNDSPSTGLTYVSCAPVSGNWAFVPNTQSNTLAATITDLKANGSAKFTVTATVDAGASGKIESLANTSSVKYDNETVNITNRAFAKTAVSSSTSVPVNVKVLFNGLKDISQVPAGYTLVGEDSNELLKGNIALTAAAKDTASGQISRAFTTTADVFLGKEYTLSFTQSGYEVDGYNCTPDTKYVVRQTPTADSKAIDVVITLNYVNEKLFTCPSVTVRTYFKGLTKLPDNFGYKLTCTSAPEDATTFPVKSPLTVTKSGVENGVPYLDFTVTNVNLLAETEQTFSFTQSGYDVAGYVCALGSSTFKLKPSLPTTDVPHPIQLNITNTYTQPDWSKLTITKAADKTRAMPGSVVKYTVTVTNNTGVDLSNIIVADKLDSNIRYSDSTGDYSTGTGTWTVASLANGKSVTLTLTVKLKYALAAGTVIDNTASVTSAAAGGQTYDLSSQKISDSVSVTVTSGKGSPRTGDESNLCLWIAVMAASLACAGAAVVIYKKRRG